MPKLVTILTCLVVSSFVSAVPPRAPRAKSARQYIGTETERANALYEKGDWKQARRAYGRILFVSPRDSRAKKRLLEINGKYSEDLIKLSDETWKTDEAEAMKILWQAHRTDPRGKPVAEALKARGYSYSRGEWLTEGERKNYAKLDHERGERRRKEIGLGDDFEITRRGVFRFFTDVKGGARKLGIMLNAIDAHYQEYLRFVALLYPRYPGEGLDVVLCTKRDSFERLTDSDSETTAGMYIPDRGASFFFLTGQGDDFNTLLHEMTHQLNDKVLQAWATPRWFEEGIAEYFGHAEVKRGGKSIKLGRATGYRLVDFLESVRGNSRPFPLSSFMRRGFTGSADQFYAQSWALTHYLMHGPAPGRMIAFDLFAGSIDNIYQDQPDLDTEWFEKTLARYDLDLETFESDFIAYFREGKVK